MPKPKTLRLPDSLRQQFKQPFGQLVSGSISDCNRIIEEVIQKEAPPKVVLVGDTVSRHAISAGLHADVVIVDNKEMRQSSTPVSLGSRKMFKLVNSQGTIASKSWDVLLRALEVGNTAVVVEGEEDLLVLVAVSVAPIRSLVVYGQPKRGVVLVRVTAERKREISRLIALMEEVTSV
ncbi:MAG TPA: GTP-dependent dephospho-CoA kinase family protein [Methylomirabilota bacterium]|nr:GTP-dependent dephospho-CoA kinase family protein [Methylomirabilota bacterium]